MCARVSLPTVYNTNSLNNVGVVAAIGTAVPSAHPHLTLGTYVAIYSIKFCGMPTCSACSSGYTNVCRGGAYGLRHDGSWASYVVVAASCVVPVPARPEVIPPGVVSTATDAILSPYHAMKSAALRPEHTVLCVGIGGLGYNAVIIAKKHFGVRCVIACDTRPSSLDNAREAGADYAVLPAELAGLVAEKSLAIDFAFDFVGGQQTFEACFAALRVGGTIHILGIGNAPVSINPLVTMFKELKVKTSFYGTKEELVEVLQLIGDGVVVPRVETRRMSECSLVLDEMLEGKLKARIALIPDTDN